MHSLFLCRSRTTGQGDGVALGEREWRLFFVNVEPEANGSVCFRCTCPKTPSTHSYKDMHVYLIYERTNPEIDKVT
jgi:hypothetical protein